MVTLNKNEKVFLVKRRHFFVFFLELLPLIILFLAVVGGMVFVFLFQIPETVKEFLNNFPFLQGTNLKYLAFFLSSLLLSIFWNIASIIITNYYLDYWIITDERTIHTELRGLFSRFYASVFHYRIQDVTVDVHGIFPTIFKYGNLKIQTAGAFKKFVFRQIPEPYETKNILLKTRKNYEKKRQNGKNFPNFEEMGKENKETG